MRPMRLYILGVAYVLFILALYRVGVKPLETLVKWLYHDQVVKRMVTDKETLSRDTPFHLGIYRPELPYDFSKVFQVEDSLHAHISIISYYQAWGDGDEHKLNAGLLANIAKGGYIPMITWEPWIVAFENHRGQMHDSSLSMVANGEFDNYIREWARQAVIFGKPMFLRYAHEFSNPWYAWSSRYGNDEMLFKEAWKHVHGIFQAEGARNVAFIWNPYQVADTTFYPGNDYVDWIGLDIFNFGPLIENGFWLDFFSILHGTYGVMQTYGKPILIAEAGTSSSGGDKNIWYRDMFQSLAKGDFPLVKGVVIFDNPVGKAPNGLPVDLSMTTDSTVYQGIFKTEAMRKLGMHPSGR